MKILATSNHGNTFNPKEGADVRKYNLLVELAKNNDVYVLESNRYQNDKKMVPPRIIVDYFHEIYFCGYPLSFLLDFNLSYILKLINIIKKEKFDVIQISFCYGIIITKLIILLINKKIKISYDAHNVEADNFFQSSNNDYSFFVKYFFWIYIPLIEKLAVNIADYVICVSNNDKLRFVEKYSVEATKVVVIPSGTKIRSTITPNSKNSFKSHLNIDEHNIIVLFHGTYNYPPNREAIDLILNYIAPTVREKLKNVMFLLAGNGVPIFEKDNVKSIGFMENLDSLLYAADIAIVPILRGGGTRLKILDYMSVGLPIVSTRKGIEGIEATNGKDAIIFDKVDEKFIEGILDLLNNRERRASIGLNAYELAKKKYNWEEVCKMLDKLYTNYVSQ